MKVNNLLTKKIFGILLIFVAFFMFSPLMVLAATGYGEGTYGEGGYGVGVTTASTNNTDNTNSSSPSNNSSAPGCTTSPPVLAPDLFQINTTSTTAKLFFTPIDVNQFYVSFSTKPNAEDYGELVTLAREGVQSHNIYLLKPNTTYYLKIRGQNGCMPGNWSNIMKIKTTSSPTRQTIFYRYTKLTTITNGIKSIFNKIVPTKNTIKTEIKMPNSTIEPTSAPTMAAKNEVTSSPTVAPAPTHTPAPNPTPITKTEKKFCVLWWCF